MLSGLRGVRNFAGKSAFQLRFFGFLRLTGLLSHPPEGAEQRCGASPGGREACESAVDRPILNELDCGMGKTRLALW